MSIRALFLVACILATSALDAAAVELINPHDVLNQTRRDLNAFDQRMKGYKAEQQKQEKEAEAKRKQEEAERQKAEKALQEARQKQEVERENTEKALQEAQRIRDKAGTKAEGATPSSPTTTPSRPTGRVGS